MENLSQQVRNGTSISKRDTHFKCAIQLVLVDDNIFMANMLHFLELAF